MKNSKRTPRNNSNEYVGFCLAYIYRDYFIKKIKTDFINDSCSNYVRVMFSIFSLAARCR